MPQSSVITFFLFAAFLVFITQRGELPTYLGLLLRSPNAAPSPSTASNTPASAATSAATVSQFVDIAAAFA